MTERTDVPGTPHRSRVWATVRALIRTHVIAGLITVLPVVLTIMLVDVIFGWLRRLSLWLVDGVLLLTSWGRDLAHAWGIRRVADEAAYHPLTLEGLPNYAQWGVTIFSILLTFLLLYAVGLFTTHVIGRRLIELMDQIVDRVPFVKTIYRTLKQILQLFGGQSSQGFQRVALVPFPNEITRSVGFITNSFKDSLTGEELCAVFIATTPNPTTGFVFILKRSDIIEVNWPVEEAVKIIMSGGILSPDYVTMLTPSAQLAAGMGHAAPTTAAPEAAPSA